MSKKNIDVAGLTLVESMFTLAIFLLVVGGVYGVLAVGKATWFEMDTSIDLQQNLRSALQKVTRELSESGFDKNGVWQVDIADGTGTNGTDILRFSIPVICHNGDNVIDSNGDVAHWGAPLTWGCTSYSCMDSDNDCATVDYKYVEYSVDADNQLVRKVLNSALVTVRQDLIVQYISNFQLSKSVDSNVVTIQLTSQKQSLMGRTMTSTSSMDVYLRN